MYLFVYTFYIIHMMAFYLVLLKQHLVLCKNQNLFIAVYFRTKYDQALNYCKRNDKKCNIFLDVFIHSSNNTEFIYSLIHQRYVHNEQWFCVLATETNTSVMSKTPIYTNLRETFQIFATFVIKQTRHHFNQVFSSFD